MRKFVWVDNGRGDYDGQIWTEPFVGPKLRYNKSNMHDIDDKMTIAECIKKHPKPEYILQ